MISAGFLGNMKTSLRAAALFRYAAINPLDNNPNNYEYEHGIPALIMMLHLLDHHFVGKKVDLNKLKDSFAVGAIHDDMNDNIATHFKKRMHYDYKLYDPATKRWYNLFTAAGFTHAVVDVYTGKKFGEAQAAAWQGIKQVKDQLDKNQVEQREIIKEAIVQGRVVKESKGLSAWDLDDTLARTKSGVRAKVPNLDGTPKPGRKVIFLAGGAGSGKSNVVRQLDLEQQGYKLVNQDISLEWLKKNAGLPTDMRDLTPEQASQLGKLGWEARKIAARKKAKFKGQGDGVVIDGTGASLNVMNKQVQEFQEAGYDVQMIFVETSLEVALQRNKARKERSLRDGIVKRNHEAVQNNKEAFKKLFGKNFAEVNTDDLKQNDPMPAKLSNQLNEFTTSYENRRLTAEEFATDGADILEQGGEFDLNHLY